jgi:hypothetical protein
MPFVKLEERTRKGIMEYFVQSDTIKEVDVEKDEQGKVIKLCVVLIGENSENEEGLEFEFTGEDAQVTYNNLSSFLKAI